MGSKVGKVILPLVAIGGLAAMTGGFGLLGGGAAAGAGAGAGAAGAAGAVGAGTAATGLGAGVAASTVPVGAMSTVPAAGFPMSTTAALQAGSSALPGLSTAATAGQAAATPWWQTAWTWVKGNNDIIGLGMSGLSAIGTMGAASQQAAFQENAIKLQEAQDSLALAEKERDSQQRLQQVLASQNNFFAAAGVNASEGSALRAAEGAKDSAERELSLYGQQRILASQAHASRRRRVSGSRTGAIAGSLLQFGQDAWQVV